MRLTIRWKVTLALMTVGLGAIGTLSVVLIREARDDAREETRALELAVASEGWLRELVMRLGPSTTVLEPAMWRDLAARSAAELLAARYAAG